MGEFSVAGLQTGCLPQSVEGGSCSSYTAWLTAGTCIVVPCGRVAPDHSRREKKPHPSVGCCGIRNVSPNYVRVVTAAHWKIRNGIGAALTVDRLCAPQTPVSEDVDTGDDQHLSHENGNVREQHTPPRRGVTQDVRLWVLEISTSGLVDTPRMQAVRRETQNAVCSCFVIRQKCLPHLRLFHARWWLSQPNRADQTRPVECSHFPFIRLCASFSGRVDRTRSHLRNRAAREAFVPWICNGI